MTRTRDVDHVQVVLGDQPVQVNINEIQAWRRSPVAEQPRLYVIQSQRLPQQRMVLEVNLSNRQVIGGAPPRVHFA
jgi:hypothetical protein